jgi:hypothetical protein
MAGTLGLREYELLAGKYRPTDPAALNAEIRRLAATGLKAADIAVALRLSHEYCMNVLGRDVAGPVGG